jgi:predicted nucleotidyltransferase/DNA-binding HxlR family transcriptional regulator
MGTLVVTGAGKAHSSHGSGRCCSIIKINRSCIKIFMDSAAATLFGKTRQAVLTRLFDQPERSWYLRELSRQTGISPGALQQELTHLLEADLISRARDGNRVLYRANTAHPIFSDLQAIVRKTCGLPARLKAALMPYSGQIHVAAIYGSLAKGAGHALSDVDLLVVGEVGFETLVQTVAPLEGQLGREISIRLYAPEEFRARRHDGDPFLKAILAGKLQILLGAFDDA